jgi:DNA polymerase-3 subunit delta
MQLAPAQLAAHLKQGLQALYVLVGDEPLAHRECLDAIRQAARLQGFDERNSLMVERGFNWQQIASYGASISLFASRRLLEINVPNGKPGVEGGKALQALASQPLSDTTVLIILPKLEREAKNSAWFSALEKLALVINLEEVPASQLPKWIGARLAQQGQQASPATLEFLAHQVEGNLLAANQEVQKLGLL